jgi:hypothetical protein
MLVSNCPRCGTEKMTFDVWAQQYRGHGGRIDWQHIYEVFAVCRHCERSTIFLLRLDEYDANHTFSPANTGALVMLEGSLNTFFKVERHVGLRDEVSYEPPQHLPAQIRSVFEEGAACLSIGCVNAAATMFRLCVDLATEPLLPPVVEGEQIMPDRKTRRDVGLRLPWLFENGLLPADLADLAIAVKDDGNDGAHRASLSEADAQDLREFSYALLDRLISEPERIRLAAERRAERRRPVQTQ